MKLTRDGALAALVKVELAIDGALGDLHRELELQDDAKRNGELALATVNAELVKVRLASLVQLRAQLRRRV